MLAIDSGKPDHERLLTQAQHELAQARTERVALEGRRWRPGRRAGLVAARNRETAAQERVDRLIPAAAEQRHARRYSVDEHDTEQRLATQCDRILERRLDRGRAHGIER